MEISQDTFIQITEVRYPILIMRQFITHSLNMEHLLVRDQFPATTDSLGNCTPQKAIL